MFIDVQDPMQFVATINLQNNGPCKEWVSDGIDQKQRDVHNFVLEALDSACSYSVSCVVNTTFSCQDDESSKVTFM